MKNIYNKLNNNLKKKLKRCKLLVLDFDGVLTDNKVYTTSKGDEMVKCDRRDGLGLSMLQKYTKVKTLILSSEKNPVVRARARKLHTPCIYKVGPDASWKKSVLSKYLNSMKIKSENVCYVGNDVNDLDCLQYVGLSVAVADADGRVLRGSNYITKAKGGDGAVRGVCELLLFAHKKYLNHED